jgi:hypothetical protein
MTEGQLIGYLEAAQKFGFDKIAVGPQGFMQYMSMVNKASDPSKAMDIVGSHFDKMDALAKLKKAIPKPIAPVKVANASEIIFII